MTVTRTFHVTFGLAITLEILRLATPPLPMIHEIMFWLAYSLLVVLGYRCATEKKPYRLAFAKTWPFVFLWFAFGYAAIRFGMGETPQSWSVEDRQLAQLGYVIASITFLPVAFLASALGVWLGRSFHRAASGGSNAA